MFAFALPLNWNTISIGLSYNHLNAVFTHANKKCGDREILKP